MSISSGSILRPFCSPISTSRDEYASHVATHTHPVVDLVLYDSWIASGVDFMASLPSVLFVQHRTDYDELPKDAFSASRPARHARKRTFPSTLDDNGRARRRANQDVLPAKSLLCKITDTHPFGLVSKQNDASRLVTIAVADLLSSLQELDRGRIQKLDLNSAFIRPLMNALFVHEDHDHFAARSADLIPEGMDTSMRPDFEVRRFENYGPAYRMCFGELKGEGSATMISVVRGLYKLAMFSKMEIVGNQLTGVLVFQAIGPKITFFLLVHPCPGLFTFVEVCTINFPR
ncbi:hypothetical protein BC940DRAFT_320967 [Gongronella butleri]|nr:hypothetical protein BC940DRAFT_320967 [Gongronella butleri]